MYLYETHVHSNSASKCAHSTPEELVQAYKRAGYAGLILTDHFVKGNTSVPRDLDWTTRMQMYYDAYLEAKAEGERIDFDVFFGIEHWYEKSREVLIYGIDLDFLIAHPELAHAGIDEYAKLVHEAGGILVHAHPNRVRAYIPPEFSPRYDVCDGIEVYNAADPKEINEKNFMDAINLKMLMTSGGDVHHASDIKIGQAGIAFERRLKDIADFINSLKKGEGHILVDGEMRIDNPKFVR